MKAFYLTLSIIFSVLILVVAFGNFGAQCSNMAFLFYPVRSNPTIVILGVAFLGVVTGFMYHGLFAKMFEVRDEEEESF